MNTNIDTNNTTETSTSAVTPTMEKVINDVAETSVKVLLNAEGKIQTFLAGNWVGNFGITELVMKISKELEINNAFVLTVLSPYTKAHPELERTRGQGGLQRKGTRDAGKEAAKATTEKEKLQKKALKLKERLAKMEAEAKADASPEVPSEESTTEEDSVPPVLDTANVADSAAAE